MAVIYKKRQKSRPHEQVGIRIVALRERMGLSRQQFAFMLGASPLTIWKWEVGEARPEAAAAALINALEQQVGKVKQEPGLSEVVGQVAIGAAAGIALIAVLQALFGGNVKRSCANCGHDYGCHFHASEGECERLDKRGWCRCKGYRERPSRSKGKR